MGGFSQPMNTVEVEKSILRLTNVTAPSSWDIHLATANSVDEAVNYPDIGGTNGNIELSWHDTPRGEDTLLKVVSRNGAFSLNPETTYRVQMVDNKAKSKDSQGGFPLIFGGPGAIDLLSGFEFTTTGAAHQYPQVLTVKLGQQAALTSLPVPPTLAATSVPRNVQLELSFGLPMDQTSVKNSTLRITDVTGNDASGHWQTDAEGGNWSLDIQVQ